MLPWRLSWILIVFNTLGVFPIFEFMLYSTVPDGINTMFNNTAKSHYGILLDPTSLSMVVASMPILLSFGTIVSIIFVLPLMDSHGRLALVVKARSMLGLIVAVCQFTSYYGFGELYLASQFFFGITTSINILALPMFLSESSPDEHRGAVTTSLSIGTAFGNLMMFLIARPGVLGGPTTWPIIPLIAGLFAIGNCIALCHIGESPVWLASKAEKVDSAKFYNGEPDDKSCQLHDGIKRQSSESWRNIIRKPCLRKATSILTVFYLMITLTTFSTESMYTVILHTSYGLSTDQSMTVNACITIVQLPLQMIGPILVDKLGRRPMVLAAAALAYGKILLMIVAQILLQVEGVSVTTTSIAIANEVLSALHSSTGINVMVGLLVSELIPPSYRILVAQAIGSICIFFSTIINVLFPILYNYNLLSFYLPFLFIQLPLVLYIYRNLPETSNLSIEEIERRMQTELEEPLLLRKKSISLSE